MAEFLGWHGAKNIVITSKRGVRNGSQEAALQELWFQKINVRLPAYMRAHMLAHLPAVNLPADAVSSMGAASVSQCLRCMPGGLRMSAQPHAAAASASSIRS